MARRHVQIFILRGLSNNGKHVGPILSNMSSQSKLGNYILRGVLLKCEITLYMRVLRAGATTEKGWTA